MEPKPRRPFALRLAMPLLFIESMAFFGLFLYGLAAAPAEFYPRLMLILGLSLGCFAGSYGIEARDNRARWICVCSLAFGILLVLFIVFDIGDPDGLAALNWKDVSEKLTGTSIAILPFVPGLLLLTIGRGVNEHFVGDRGQANDSFDNEPPPPPLFEP